MQIKADKEGIEAVQQLCDLALKAGGVQNLSAVNTILAGLTPIEETNGSVRPE